MKLTRAIGLALPACVLFAVPTGVFAQEERGRSIEEVVVTAERKESSVQDTSISITAFTGDMIDDFGIRNQSDLQNMVPATTIQPYDSAVRGVGRNFRNLGGDPGVATYMNGIYSEDLYTATIGSLFDVERIEVLRGPQGTLYGRNAVGGAMNFIYKRPTDEFEATARTTIGSYNTLDGYGMISGPLIQDKLNGRFTASSRRHDGWVDELGPTEEDLDSGDELNLALQLEWRINDRMNAHVRTNKAKVHRTFGGADGGGLIVLAGENTILPGANGLHQDATRNYDVQTHSLRNVDPNQTLVTASDFVDPTQPILTFTNPTTGADILAQRVRPGVDSAVSSFRNHGRSLNLDPNQCVFSDRNSIEGDDLCAFTNGLNVEEFDQKGTQFEFEWDVSDRLTLKYLFGYNTLIYRRVTEDDSSAAQLDDRQFYVNHEADYVSHEIQAFWDLRDNVTFTSGIFFYDSVIDQRYDFFSSTASAQFTDPNFATDPIGASLGVPGLGFLVGQSTPGLFTARDQFDANGLGAGDLQLAFGPWLGDATLEGVNHGIATTGTDLLGANRTEREAFAVYTQGVWDINEKFTLTAGVRYARDEIEGQENLAQYAETTALFPILGIDLATLNILRGAIDPATLQPTGAVEPYLLGVPFTFMAHRRLEREDDDVTWRVNLDYNITDSSLIYANVTTGFRSGGFNLAFFSQTPQFDPEELIAYELGFKGQFADNTLQLNASAYLYDYDAIHTRTEEACPPIATPQSAQSACAVVDSTTSIEAAPGAEIKGVEAEVLWLATDRLTLGGNFSYTDASYTESFFVVDGADPRFPGTLYDTNSNPDRRIDIKGNRMLQVPETKANVYASYLFPMGANGNLNLLANWSYIGDVYFSAYEAELDRAPSYDRLDLRATWTSADERWIVAGFVNNVFDEIGIRQILRHGQADGFRRTAQVTEPRLYGIDVTFSFR